MKLHTPNKSKKEHKKDIKSFRTERKNKRAIKDRTTN